MFDLESLRKAVIGVDYVFNLAGQTRALKNSDYFSANCLGSKNLFLALKEINPNIKRLLHFSSLAAIGPSSDYQTEDTTPHPVTPYGESKLESEKIARSFMDVLPITIVRPPVVYGPRDKSGLVIFKSAARGVCFGVKGRNPRLLPIYVEDLVDGCILLAHHEESVGEAYFLCGDEETTPKDLFSILCTGEKKKILEIPFCLASLFVLGLELKAQFVKKPNRLNSAKLTEISYPAWLASNSKAKELGFKNRVSLKDGMLKTYTWYKENGWL